MRPLDGTMEYQFEIEAAYIHSNPGLELSFEAEKTRMSKLYPNERLVLKTDVALIIHHDSF